MVDAVLAFEGERGYPFRILRGAKNRFGATDEIGVFEMGDAGLREVRNPSALFLNTSGERAAGAAVFAGIEGSPPSRPRVPCWWSSRPWWRPAPTAPRAALWWAGTAAAWPWCWRCWRRA